MKKKAATKKAVFVDRDGTLNRMVYDETHGVMDSPRRVEQVELCKGAAKFLKGVQALRYLAIVVTNQPGIAKGTLSIEELNAVNRQVADLLAADGAEWDDLRYCPHHPKGSDGGRAEFTMECSCRKPLPGMLLAAAEEHGIDLAKSWMVGDGLNDIQAGRAAGCRTVLVTNLKIEQIERFLKIDPGEPDHIVPDLAHALAVIRRSAG